MKRITSALFLSLATAGAASAAGLQAGAPGFPGTPLPHMTTLNAPCGAVQSVVQRHNHAYLRYADAGNWLVGYASNRVVKDHRFCLLHEVATPIWVPTRDAAQCFAGFTCQNGQSPGRRGR